MSRLIRSRKVAIVIAAMTLAQTVETSAMDWANGDQDGTQDPSWMCDTPQDCNRVVDPQIEPGQDEQVKPEKVVDPHFKPEREPDSEPMIDSAIEPVERPEENRIIDPPEKIDPDCQANRHRLSDLEMDDRGRSLAYRQASGS